MNRAHVLLVALAAPALAGACIDENLLNPMADRQPKVKAYGASAFYDDTLAMRQPVPNTVPRERITRNPVMTEGKVAGPNGQVVYATSIPMKVDRAFLALGQKHYNITCGTCHGPLGDGDSIVGRQMALRPPPSLIPYKDRPVGYLFEVATNGFGMMASYAGELPLKERWAVVAYIRALQLSQSVPVAEAPADVRARLEQEAR